MLDLERLSERITWIDLSFVERRRTPGWAIQVGIRCHLAGISLWDASQFLDELGVQRSHVAVHERVHKADRQPISTVTADQLAVDEKMIRLHGQDHWLYSAADPQTSEICQVSLFPTITKQTTRWFLVDDADYLGPVLAEDGYRFQVISHGSRNAIERVFREAERRTSSFANIFSHVTLGQQNRGSKSSPSTTAHAKRNAMVLTSDSITTIIMSSDMLERLPMPGRR